MGVPRPLCRTWPWDSAVVKKTRFNVCFNTEWIQGVEDKTGCERATTACVQPLDGGVSVIDHFCSASRTLKRSQETQSEAARGKAQCKSHVPPPLCRKPIFFFFLAGGKLQGLTSKSKVQHRNQNVSRTPSKNHRTPHSCDEEKQWRLQSQHHFPPFFPPDLHVLPFCFSHPEERR